MEANSTTTTPRDVEFLPPRVPRLENLDTSLFCSYPWSTDVLTSVTNLEEVPDERGWLKNYLPLLQQQEQERLGDPGRDYAVLSDYLSGRRLALAQDSIDKCIFRKLMEYRLVDVAEFATGRSLRKADRGHHVALPSSSRMFAERLQDFQSLISKTVECLGSHFDTESRGIKAAQVDSTSAQHEGSSARKLYQGVCQVGVGKKAQKILLNLHLAALHLSYLLEGHLDLPKDIDALEDHVTSRDSDVSEHDRKLWRSGRPESIKALKGPLSIALSVSPLYLLLPIDVQKRPGQAFLMNTWKAIGSIEPPPDVVSAEREIWRILFEAATGGDLNVLVREAVKAMDDLHPSGSWPLMLPAIGGSDQVVPPPLELKQAGKGCASSTLVHLSPQGVLSDAVRQALDPSDPATALQDQSATPQVISSVHDLSDPYLDTQPLISPSQRPFLTGNEASSCPSQPPVTEVKGVAAGSSAERGPYAMLSDESMLIGEEMVSSPLSEPLSPITDGPKEADLSPCDTLSLDSQQATDKSSTGTENATKASPEPDRDRQTTDPSESDAQAKKLMEAKRRRAAAAEARKKALKEAAFAEASRKQQVPTRQLRRLLFNIPAWAQVIDLTKDDAPTSRKIGQLKAGAAIKASCATPEHAFMLLTRNSYKVYGRRRSIPIPGSKEPYEFTPEFHLAAIYWHHQFKRELDWFEQLMDQAILTFVDGQPRYMTRPEDSRISVIPRDAYVKLSGCEALAKLKDRHLLITSFKDDGHSFDSDCFRLLGSFERQVIINDLSKSTKSRKTGREGPGRESSDSEDYGMDSDNGIESEDSFLSEAESSDESDEDVDVDETLRQKKGYPLDLVFASQSNPPTKSLNCLDFPLGKDFFDPVPPFASEDIAWYEVAGLPFCRPSDHFPTEDVRWGIAGTKGAFHKFHVDTDGYMTFIQVETGYKLWFIVTPKPGRSFEDFADINLHLRLYDNHHKIDTEKYDIEVVVLTATSALAMRPNTLHAVYTPADAVCRGGHFYPISTIRDSVYGLYHTFVASGLVTNADHWQASQKMLTRILALIHRNLLLPVPAQGIERAHTSYNHVTDLRTWEGILDQLCLHNFFELGNVLNFAPGEDDAQGRKRAVTNRQRSRQIIAWIFANSQFKSTSNGAVTILSGERAKETICHAFLAHQARALVLYKSRADSRQLVGTDPSVTASDVAQGVLGALSKKALEHYLRIQDDEIESFAWSGGSYEVQSCLSTGWALAEEDGLTPDDEKYIRTRMDIANKDESAADGVVNIGGEPLILRPADFVLKSAIVKKERHVEDDAPPVGSSRRNLKRSRSRSTVASAALEDPGLATNKERTLQLPRFFKTRADPLPGGLHREDS
ncbi:hypothetical protein DXG01_005226 [Tephrocybe rancida]|nr:hypothetical protein DXG01_005226 [Tephrocybe rancida]